MNETEKVSKQRVYVKLDAVTALAAEWARVNRELDAKRGPGVDVNDLIHRKRALDFVFNTLELPRQ